MYKNIKMEINGRPDLSIIAVFMSLEAQDLNPLFNAIIDQFRFR